MSSQIKPIKLWGKSGPNPPKVIMALEALDVPYEQAPIDFADVKKPEYLAVNPNGRLPAIQDPNTNITLWESGAIVEYLVEQYDKERRLSFAPGSPEFYSAKQWLYFQTTGQGPYYGQGVWFKKFHGEQLPTATERYVKEINRVSSVLEGVLTQQKEKYGDSDGPWLVGNKFSYADLSFIPWQTVINQIFTKDEYDDAKYPNVKEWLERMASRKPIQVGLDALARR